MYRTHTCGELRAKHENSEVTLAGWVHKVRTHGALTFVDLRDRYGITQITINSDDDLDTDFTKESVIQIKGVVVKKPEANKALETGEIEVIAKEVNVLSKSEPLPIDNNATEDNRLKYRYLDIRNNGVIDNLAFRSEAVLTVRNFFRSENFLEIETPLLVKSTPEGARDYVVPSRINKGMFYALPQSPQLYKQILMIAGADKYFQLAKCLRDEDLRADRQPEHTQIDFEMSFVHQEDIQAFVERLMKDLFKRTLNKELDSFPVFSYDNAMARFGSDKPDIRFGLELTDVTKIGKETDFAVFKEAEVVNAIFVEKDFSRKEIDKYTDLVKTYRAKGLAYSKIVDNKFDGGVSKFLDASVQEKIISAINATGKTGTVFFVADRLRISQTALGHLRNKLALDLELYNKDDFKFCWVNDFPLFSYNEEEDKWEPEHHMFSMPKPEFVNDFESRPGEVKGDLWDLVLNGWEMASGSIRVSNPKVQERIMNFIGLNKEEANEKFGFLLDAYKYGGPIHGGMGIGVDRLVALMLQFTDIRAVMAFPKNKNAQCPMDDSPNKISEIQLDELSISINK
ncbi:aspartate--tRNA ligase [Candidatus Woesearchaeota archaeon]|nr:aspartate--tRNA ligase [Candidatus Woesearchaeota archaeon]